MARQTLKRTAKICLDILLFLLVWFGEYAIHKWFTPYRRGFFCSDESLAYPFRESTIGLLGMAVIVFTIPPLVILAVELFKRLEPYKVSHLAAKRKSTPASSNGAPPATGTSNGNSIGCHIGYRLLQCYKHIGYYLFGLGLILMATEIPKFAVGRLRPNFFAICQPQMPDGTTCDDDINQGRYIMDYTCVGQNFSASTVAQVNQSFPSGHSSIFFYAMLYLCMYLQAALSTRASKLLKHVLQFVFMMFALYASLTRVSDYWHHWSDVLSGILLGTITAIVVALYMTDLFERRSSARFVNTFKTHVHRAAAAAANSSASSTGKSTAAAATVLPAYTFGTMPYLHYTPHHAQYSHATYQNYGYVP